jgi:hypothetical protein
MDLAEFAEQVLGQKLMPAQREFLKNYDPNKRYIINIGRRPLMTPIQRFLRVLWHPSTDMVRAIDEFLSYTPTGQTDYGYALGWATAQKKLLCHLVALGVLEQYEADWLEPKWPDRKWFVRVGRGRPAQRS